MPLVNRILCALDTADLDRAAALARALEGAVGGVKLGKVFFTAHGPAGVRKVAAVGLPVFLDLKFHDIPNTVAGAVRAACALRPFMVTVHAAGGEAMLRASVQAAAEAGSPRPLMIAVTVLTSLEAADLSLLGVADTPEDQVLRLARLARAAGLDGVVCSPREIAPLRAALGPDVTLVTPGIRPQGADREDQKRTMTPEQAVALGADYLVIGRPITEAADPAEAARRIAGQIAAAA